MIQLYWKFLFEEWALENFPQLQLHFTTLLVYLPNFCKVKLDISYYFFPIENIINLITTMRIYS